ncbi:hypothetical protein ACTFIW_007671 [Dictyostelium discoideum]
MENKPYTPFNNNNNFKKKNNNNNNNNNKKTFFKDNDNGNSNNITLSTGLDYLSEKEKCKDFLNFFKCTDNGNIGGGFEKYVEMMKEITQRKRKNFDIELDDVYNFNRDPVFVESIENQTSTYLRLFTYALDELIPPPDLSSTKSAMGFNNNNNNNDDDGFDKNKEDQKFYQNSDMVLDLLASQRIQRKKFLQEQNRLDPDSNEFDFPQEIIRRFELHFIPRKEKPIIPIRLIRSELIGRLVTFSGVVTRVTDVKPLVVISLYTCDICGAEIFQEITSREFMPLFQCKSKQCTEGGKQAGNLTLQTRGSKFVKFQEIKVQEIANQVPIGHTPRSIKIYVRGELTRMASPGDIVTMSGIFLPTPYTGHKAIKAGLLADTYIEAMQILQHKKTYEQLDLTEEMLKKIQDESQNENIYDRLAMSLAPEIYGHLDVKKALLLMMVGGESKHMKDGMNIRGDINICLMGDPGIAKSQLLKHIAKVAPRGIYTSGKGSSGVGLTAAVIRDSMTGEFVLEGGSLVLADMGICCIDEFDKMEDSDRTAIHEVMEQQTISIAKAGITTTLNARTSILAAANPAYGRYNFDRSPDENFRLPHSLLSRFDLLFLMVDKADMDNDRLLSEHVTYVHMHSKPPQLSFEPFDSEFIRAYVSQARKIIPPVPKDLTNYIVDSYITLRKQDSETKTPFTYTTARTLLGVLRLSQAFARLKFSQQVSQEDVEESMRLMFVSKQSIRFKNEKKTPQNPSSIIYTLIKDHCALNRVKKVSIFDIQQKVFSSGFTQQHLDDCLNLYKSVLNSNSNFISLI